MNKTDSDFDDSEDSYLRSSVVFINEECERIRFNLLNDDCMKLTEEEICFFDNLSARSASWHDNDGLPEGCDFQFPKSDSGLLIGWKIRLGIGPRDLSGVPFASINDVSTISNFASKF